MLKERTRGNADNGVQAENRMQRKRSEAATAAAASVEQESEASRYGGEQVHRNGKEVNAAQQKENGAVKEQRQVRVTDPT
jgi:hypothetical protein